MPELPEVETIVTGLRPILEGQVISQLQRSQFKMRRDSPSNALHLLQAQRISAIERRAKYILLHCTNKHSLLIHLGMSGRLLFYNKAAKPEILDSHHHLQITLADGGLLTLRDPRRFGMYEVVPTAQIAIHPALTSLGLEPLEGEFDAGYLYQRIRNSRQNIKSLIMDSHIVVGVGNIYASESLFMSRINPNRLANSLSMTECAALVVEIKAVLRKAISSGGSSFRDYVHADGSVGNFQNEFMVYGRSKAECLLCHTIIQRIVQSGRATFFCPTCQGDVIK